MRIHPLDLAIVIAYLLGVTALGIHFRRGQQDARDYFLGGRTAPWWALAFSIVATETSTLTIIGTPAISYGGNLTFLQLVFGYLIGRVLIVLLLLPGYFRGEYLTAYALIEKRFGEKMRAVAASTFLITRAIAEGVRVSAIALVVSVVLGTSEKLAVLIVVALTVLYTFEGGMKAIIWTDVSQLLLYLTGSAVTFFVLLHRIPGGWSEVTQVAAAAGNKLQVFDFSWNLATKYTFWSGLIGGAFLTMATHGTDQIIVQRLLAAKSEGDSRRALLTSGVIVLIQFTIFLLDRRFALRVRAAHSATRGRRAHRSHPSAFHRARNAHWPCGIDDCFHRRRSHVQRERLAEFPSRFQRPRFLSAAWPQYGSANSPEPFTPHDSLMGSGVDGLRVGELGTAPARKRIDGGFASLRKHAWTVSVGHVRSPGHCARRPRRHVRRTGSGLVRFSFHECGVYMVFPDWCLRDLRDRSIGQPHRAPQTN